MTGGRKACALQLGLPFWSPTAIHPTPVKSWTLSRPCPNAGIKCTLPHKPCKDLNFLVPAAPTQVLPD